MNIKIDINIYMNINVKLMLILDGGTTPVAISRRSHGTRNLRCSVRTRVALTGELLQDFREEEDASLERLPCKLAMDVGAELREIVQDLDGLADGVVKDGHRVRPLVPYIVYCSMDIYITANAKY